ncbi:hypothetical protein EDD86DRAFT_262738 [Gorgonomyces haynaldii]|nr:hypothetical protein EDD86DRAFT_262738 [Gorgonomyces haynaldii]
MVPKSAIEYILLALSCITLVVLVLALIYVYRQKKWNYWYRIRSILTLAAALLATIFQMLFTFTEAPPIISFLANWFASITGVLLILSQMEILKQFQLFAWHIKEVHIKQLQILWGCWYIVAWIPSYAHVPRMGEAMASPWKEWDGALYVPWVMSAVLYETFQTFYLEMALRQIYRSTNMSDDDPKSTKRRKAMFHVKLAVWSVFLSDYLAIGLYGMELIVNPTLDKSIPLHGYLQQLYPFQIAFHVVMVMYIMRLVKHFMQAANAKSSKMQQTTA